MSVCASCRNGSASGYQIVSAWTAERPPGIREADRQVQEKVKRLLAAGWQPLGPAQTSNSTADGYNGAYLVSQTMVKYDT